MSNFSFFQVFSGGQGDVNSQTMYIVRVASRQQGKFGDFCVLNLRGQGDANFE